MTDTDAACATIEAAIAEIERLRSYNDRLYKEVCALRFLNDNRNETINAMADLPQSADTLEDARTLALHYQKIAAEQGSKIMRIRIALKIIRKFGDISNGYHAGVMLIMHEWMDSGMDSPVPWPESAFFDTWAAAQGMSNVDGFVGYRLIVAVGV